MDCIICFCPIEDISIRCCDSQCLARICLECSIALFSYSAQNNIMPTCPSKNCQGFFLSSEIRKLGDKSIKLYEDMCLQYVLKEKKDTASLKIAHENIINKLRQERSIFIQQNFPLAISHVASIAFKPRLSHLSKLKTQALSDKLKSSNRLCINLYCTGRLDPQLKCMVCLTQFCDKCEQAVDKGTHTCNKDDLESVATIKKMIHCPKCQFPVEKSDGCNSITCSNCKTNFDYSTGQHGGHGSHNNSINVRVKYKISVMFGDKLDPIILNTILEIESYEPNYSDKALLNTVKAHILQPDQNPQMVKKIVKQFEDSITYKYRMRLYIAIQKEIENLFSKNLLTLTELTKLKDKLVYDPLFKSCKQAKLDTQTQQSDLLASVSTPVTQSEPQSAPKKIIIKKIVSKIV